VAYDRQPTLFGGEDLVKLGNLAVVNAFQQRLKERAGFKCVPTPLAMCNSKNADIYYRFFASQNQTAQRIASHIFLKHKECRRG